MEIDLPTSILLFILPLGYVVFSAYREAFKRYRVKYSDLTTREFIEIMFVMVVWYALMANAGIQLVYFFYKKAGMALEGIVLGFFLIPLGYRLMRKLAKQDPVGKKSIKDMPLEMRIFVYPIGSFLLFMASFGIAWWVKYHLFSF